MNDGLILRRGKDLLEDLGKGLGMLFLDGIVGRIGALGVVFMGEVFFRVAAASGLALGGDGPVLVGNTSYCDDGGCCSNLSAVCVGFFELCPYLRGGGEEEVEASCGSSSISGFGMSVLLVLQIRSHLLRGSP